MSMVAMVLYNPAIPARDPVVARMFLPCSTSRVTIMRVRRTLSETEIERCGRVRLSLPHPQEWEASTAIPVPTFVVSTHSTTTSSRRRHIHTHGGKVHEAGEGDGPEIPAEDYETTVKLEELALDSWAGGSRIEQTKRPSANQ